MGLEVGIWNIPGLYFQDKEASLQRVRPWNIPDPDFHWEPLRDSQGKLESGIFQGSTSNTKKVIAWNISWNIPDPICFNWDLLSLSGPISVTTDMCQLVLLVISSAFAALATPALLQSLRLASLLQSMASVTQDSPHLPQQCLDLFILSIDVWGPRAGIIFSGNLLKIRPGAAFGGTPRAPRAR